MCIEEAKSGSVFIVMGVGKRMLGESIFEAACREDMPGVFRYCNTDQRGLDLVGSRGAGAGVLGSYQFPLDKVIVGSDRVRDSKKSEGIKVTVLLVVEMNRAEGCDVVGVNEDNTVIVNGHVTLQERVCHIPDRQRCSHVECPSCRESTAVVHCLSNTKFYYGDKRLAARCRCADY